MHDEKYIHQKHNAKTERGTIYKEDVFSWCFRNTIIKPQNIHTNTPHS